MQAVKSPRCMLFQLQEKVTTSLLPILEFTGNRLCSNWPHFFFVLEINFEREVHKLKSGMLSPEV